jgi:hypothetical protein
MRGRIPVWPFSFGPRGRLSDLETAMAEDLKDTIEQNAQGPK